MTKVVTGATMSLDGYIAGPDDTGFEYLFKWYSSGDVEIPNANPELTVRTSAVSAQYIRDLKASTGAIVCGRHLYDLTDGWGGRSPMDVTTVVLTHRPPTDRPVEDENFVFVTEGIEAAVAKARELAGDKNVVVNSGTIARQTLDAGLLDEVHVDLVPVLLGRGTQFFGQFESAPVELEGPISMLKGEGVIHLGYRVVRTNG
jgi:dihydrofolate reductase